MASKTKTESKEQIVKRLKRIKGQAEAIAHIGVDLRRQQIAHITAPNRLMYHLERKLGR